MMAVEESFCFDDDATRGTALFRQSDLGRDSYIFDQQLFDLIPRIARSRFFSFKRRNFFSELKLLLCLFVYTDVIDIVKDQLPGADYTKEEDPVLYVSEKTGRGPLSENWIEEYWADVQVRSTDIPFFIIVDINSCVV